MAKIKKYIIHDEDGKEFEVKEFPDEKVEEIEEIEEKSEDVHDELTLTDDEISALKGLAAVAPKLMALLNDGETHDEDEDEVIDDEDEDKISEEIIDTDEDEKRGTCDSKRSFNAIENRKKKTNDSIDPDEDINTAWAKRYNRG